MRCIGRWTIAVLTGLAAVASVAAVGTASAAHGAKAPKTVSCKDVIAKGGNYKATSIRVTAMGVAEARKYLFTWVQRGSKSLPHYQNFWHSRRVAGGRWLVEYGHKKVRPTITFLIKAVVKRAPYKPPVSPPAPAPPAPAPPAPAPDTTPPVIHLTSPLDGEKLQYGTAVTAHFTCTDNVAVARCDGTFADGATIPTDVLGTHQFVVTATDTAGNVSVVTATYTVGDATPPTITITAPTAGLSVGWGVTTATAQYSCSDNVAVASCTAAVGTTTVANKGPLPSTGAPGPGTRTLTVTAKDTSGNTSTQSVDYTVQPAGYYALTFDDGPNATYTQQVLAALDSVHAKATFCLVGQNVNYWPQWVQAEVADGMTICNHTQTHANLGPQTDPSTEPVTTTNPTGEVSGGAASIKAAAPTATVAFLRPPYGETDAKTEPLAQANGEQILLWTVDTNDWTGASTASIVATAETVKPGGIILMHDAYPNTVAAVPQIVTGLANQSGLMPGKPAYDPTVSVPHPWDPDGTTYPPFHVIAVAP